jgi:enoyl-CoA hydratase/carnithine racemase
VFGGEFALACDLRCASLEKAIFGQPEVGSGLIPGGGGIERLPLGCQWTCKRLFLQMFLAFWERQWTSVEVLERALLPNAPPAAISSAVMDMLGDEALRAASRSFASGVSRFGELTRAAELIERAVVAELLPHDGDMNTSAVIEPTGPDVNLQYRCFQSALQPEN